jgi:triacylglycerol lipase
MVSRATLRVRCAQSSARRGSVGLYGFDVRGPAAFPKMQVHYWKNVLEILRNTVGADAFVTSVPPCVSHPPSASPALMTCPQDSVNRRARVGARPRPLRARIRPRREPHGALDGRARLPVPNQQIPARRVHPALVTTISTSHHGSPFMDLCAVRTSAL